MLAEDVGQRAAVIDVLLLLLFATEAVAAAAVLAAAAISPDGRDENLVSVDRARVRMVPPVRMLPGEIGDLKLIRSNRKRESGKGERGDKQKKMRRRVIKKEKKTGKKKAHQQQRVQHETDSVVDPPRLRERLVPALVGLDPDARADGPLEPPIGEPGEAAEEGNKRRRRRVRKESGDSGRGGDRERGREGEVERQGQRRTQQGPLEAVRRNRLAQGADGEGRRRGGLALEGGGGRGRRRRRRRRSKGVVLLHRCRGRLFLNGRRRDVFLHRLLLRGDINEG